MKQSFLEQIFGNVFCPQFGFSLSKRIGKPIFEKNSSQNLIFKFSLEFSNPHLNEKSLFQGAKGNFFCFSNHIENLTERKP